uniref:Tailless n=1 Tax=Polyrhachis vicina TaxID=455035 RepID=D9I2W8_9HYME|nr:tailless [Polyrhachis vicina]
MQNQESQLPHMPVAPPKMPASSSRILYDIPCKVCRDHSSGKHYGIFACDGCAGFFKRSIRRNRQYVCKAKSEGGCMVDKTHRNQCRACRLAKCIQAGMNKDAVQHERGPRNSTLRRQQMALYSIVPCMMRSLARMYPPAGKSCTLDLGGAPKPLEHYCHRDDGGDMHNHRVARSSYHNELVDSDNKNNDCDEELPLEDDEIEAESIWESAARLLFMNVNWVRRGLSLAKGTSLPLPDQLQKLEDSWRELFILAAAQYLPPLDLTHLLEIEGELNRAICWEVSCFRETLADIRQMRLDPHEYVYIRALVLFKSIYACYYIPSSIWSNGSVCFNTADSEDKLDGTGSMDYNDGGQLALTSPLHDPTIHEGRFGLERRKGDHGEENLPLSSEDMPDHYIYVSYPPELKRRLLESCYNRTTRL